MNGIQIYCKGAPRIFDDSHQLNNSYIDNITFETRNLWKENSLIVVYYLDKLVRRFGDLRLALEAYNHGPSQLSHYLRRGVRPKRYSGKVFYNYRKIKAQSI